MTRPWRRLLASDELLLQEAPGDCSPSRSGCPGQVVSGSCLWAAPATEVRHGTGTARVKMQRGGEVVLEALFSAALPVWVNGDVKAACTHGADCISWELAVPAPKEERLPRRQCSGCQVTRTPDSPASVAHNELTASSLMKGVPGAPPHEGRGGTVSEAAESKDTAADGREVMWPPKPLPMLSSSICPLPAPQAPCDS